MAKIRVHQLAKIRNIASKDLLVQLQAAGINVKAAASAVDEEAAMKALDAPPAPPEPAASKGSANLGDLGVPKVSQAPSPSDPPPTKAPPETKPHPQRTFEPDEAPKPAASSPKPAASPAKPAASTSKPAASRPPASGGAGAGKMRRVVIDSQASRRGAPGPPPAGAGKGGRRSKGGRRRRPLFEEPVVEVVEEIEPSKVVVQIKSGSSVKEVSEFLGMPASDLIKKLMELGEMATLTQTLSDEAIGVLAESFERNVEIVSVADENVIAPLDSAEEEAASIERPPVVTIMGHVDHGKTSLLDAIRRTEVAAGEAGGITQHIGAYQVHHNDKLVTFIDTPGHEAFTAMRARGAKVTDIAVIVVAADDGMKPQTEEALDHAKAAGVPTVIAVNKIDKEGADPQKVRSELAKLGLTPEDWGGETIFCDVSAKTGEGLDHLLDMLQLVAEVEELKGNPDADATGTVIESKLDSGRGPVVSLLIQRGQLMAGQAMVAGPTWGRVRAMHDHTGANLKHAEIGMPVEVLGFDSVPAAGEVFRVVKNDREARQLAGDRANRLKTEAIARNRRRKVSLEDVFAQVGEGSLKNLNLVVKGDVAGSVGALEDEFAKLPQSEVQVNVIHRGVGGITESDVMLASASDAVVIGFNVRPVGDSRLLADKERVEIRTYNVIYKVIEELRSAMQGLLDPEEIEDAVGSATVRQVFKASKVGTIAGAHVEDGKLTRGATVRLVRDGTVVYEGKLDSLKRFNDDVREVAIGHECGVVLENFADVKEGDVIEAYSMRSVERELA